MSVNTELAAAARRVSALVDQLPEDSRRPDVPSLWSDLVDEVERCRSEGMAQLTIVQWLEDFEASLPTEGAAP
jgi:hypothetical protein